MKKMRTLKMKSKTNWASEMKTNLLPKNKEANYFSGLEKLSFAASLAEELELDSLAETLTNLTENVNV